MALGRDKESGRAKKKRAKERHLPREKSVWIRVGK